MTSLCSIPVCFKELYISYFSHICPININLTAVEFLLNCSLSIYQVMVLRVELVSFDFFTVRLFWSDFVRLSVYLSCCLF